MEFFNLILGFILIIIGFILINETTKTARKNGNGGLYFKLGVGGLGLIIIGVFLIADELIKIF